MSEREFHKNGSQSVLPQSAGTKQIEEHHPMPGETIQFEGGVPASRKFNKQYAPGKGESNELDGYGLSQHVMNPY